MDRKAFQKLVDDTINPDYYFEQRLKTKVISAQPAEQKRKNTKRIWISALSGVLCLVLALGVFGFSRQSNKVLPGSVMIAGANVLESNVDMIYRYGVAVEDTRGKTETQAADEWMAKRQVLDNAINHDTIQNSLGHGSHGTEDVWLYDVQGDAFEICVDNPDEVKEIRMYNENPILIMQYQFLDSEWSEEELFMMTEEDEEYWTEVETDNDWYMLGKNGERMYWEEFFQRWLNSLHIGHELTADGERFARARASEEENETSSQFQIYLFATDDAYDGSGICEAIEENPDFQIASITDKVTFEVEFKNGDVAKSVVNVGFNDDGFMIVSLDSYEYIEA